MALVEDSKIATVSVGPDKDGAPDIVAGEALDIPSGASHLQRKLGGKEVQ